VKHYAFVQSLFVLYLPSIKKDRELAKLFGQSQTNFSNKKKRGTLINLIIEYSINEKVNLNWLLTGKDTLNDNKKDEQIENIIKYLKTLNKEELIGFEITAKKLHELKNRLSELESKIEVK